MQATSLPQPATAMPLGIAKRAGKYLIFHLGLEEFGTEVPKVREIMGLQDITAIPQVPAHFKGVINLRGKVIPVIDLRLKFGMKPQEYTSRTCIIVMRTRQAEEDLMIGMIVDGVVEVLNLMASDIEDTPEFGPGVVTPYLTGMAKIKGRVRMLLGIARSHRYPVQGGQRNNLLKLPLTLAIIEGLVVGLGKQRYIIPIFAVREMFRPTSEMLSAVQQTAEMSQAWRTMQKASPASPGIPRFNNEVRSMIDFERPNLMAKLPEGYLCSAIFCRDIMIYFDNPTQQSLVHRLTHHLEDGGYLFIGHSESLNYIAHNLEYISPAIYRKPGIATNAQIGRG